MKIIVTGAAGFIATNLLPRLLAEGHEVVGVDNFFLGRHEYVDRFLPHQRFQFHEFDLLDREHVIALFESVRPDCVWHVAANSDISFGTTYTDFDLKGGTHVTYNVLEAMRLSGALRQCCRMICRSSSVMRRLSIIINVRTCTSRLHLPSFNISGRCESWKKSSPVSSL